jgi:GAF domain-containing protein
LTAERYIQRVHLLLETTRRLMEVPELDGLLRLLAETTARMVNAERATIFLTDPLRGELWSKVVLDEALQTIRMPIGVGIAGAAARTGKMINVPDAYADGRFNREVDRTSGFRTRNLLAIPMKAADGHVLGVFEVVNKRTGSFEPEDVELLSSLATSAALAFEKRSPHI